MYRILLSVFSFSVLIAQGQDLKLLDVGYARYPAASIKDNPNEAEVGFEEYKVGLKIPMVLKDRKWILLHGLQYALVRPAFDSQIGRGEESLHFISYALSVIKPLKNDFRLIGTLQPAISSQLDKSISGDDFLYLGALSISKKVSEDINWLMGLAFTSRFGRPLAIPLFGYNRKWERFRLNVLLPNGVSAQWLSINSKWEYGFRLGLNGSQFNLSDTNMQQIEHVRFSRINLGPSINYGLREGLYLQVFGGISVRRTYTITSKVAPDQGFGSDNGAFFAVSLFFRPLFLNKAIFQIKGLQLTD